ncbi:hypothetical protein [Stenotrophomonas tumulicola]|uniref:Transmembrane protein n=1 Tax=Stenotrophomonas tumulicola TaxID=1685415 RepID=A0A7W3FJ63_9GAMM|nr:hypothetical protein [Stenotrophomonas tumulicola]MBA8680489.1 hypothetical protein [Stenotrophomonas tumulicola]
MNRGNVRSIGGNNGFSSTISPLDNSGGGGNDGGMEARIAKLETSVEYIQRDVAEIRMSLDKLNTSMGSVQTDTAVIKARLAHTPTTLKMWAALVAVVVPVGAAVVGLLTWVVQTNIAPLLAKAAGG